MSGTGERDDAPEVETVEEAEIEQAVEETEGEEGEAADEDAEDGAAEGEQEEGGEEAPEVAAKPRSAATIAVQEAKRAAKEAKAEAEASRRELEQLRQERQGRQTAEDKRLEQERVALMAPEEKTDYLLQRQQQEFNGRFGALEFRMQDASDRTGFENLCARNPAFDAVRDEVEQTLTTMRNNGGNSTRETVATYLIGKRAIERAAKGGKSKQAAKGASRVQQNRVAAPSGRSDVKGGDSRRGGDEKAAREKRLLGQNL